KGEAEAEKALRGPLRELSRLVLEPLLPHVGKSKQWIVSPDSNLWLVPWEILLLKDGRYAVESHSVRYVLSGRDLLAGPSFKGNVRRPLVLADPDFNLDARSARAEITRLIGERVQESAGDSDAEKSQLVAKRGVADGLRGLSGSSRLGGIKRLP